ncbi:unnamed protein product, partial [Arctogadus glacialis]
VNGLHVNASDTRTALQSKQSPVKKRLHATCRTSSTRWPTDLGPCTHPDIALTLIMEGSGINRKAVRLSTEESLTRPLSPCSGRK